MASAQPTSDGQPRSRGSKGSRASEASDPAGVSSKRSASTLRHLVKAAEKEMTRLQRVRDRLADSVTSVDPTDHVRLAELGRELAEAEAALAAAEERWLELIDEAER